MRWQQAEGFPKSLHSRRALAATTRSQNRREWYNSSRSTTSRRRHRRLQPQTYADKWQKRFEEDLVEFCRHGASAQDKVNW